MAALWHTNTAGQTFTNERFLAALGLPPTAENVWILNPFDARSAVWDLSEGERSPALARSIAKLIVPEERNSSAPYFTDAARELIFATIRALNHVAPGRWSRALPDRSIHQHQHGGWLGGLHHVLELPGLRVRFLELGGDCGDGFHFHPFTQYAPRVHDRTEERDS